ncbi:DnaB-like helicase C-terminal domain-containing protein [Peribacillus muralis]|uniref:DnaB-like helicase C-terminal domain-containing protein n=1 Tax=Peribacillus muralis TaxID=264697 RepID=UPI003670F5B1
MLLEAKLLSKVLIDKDFWTLARYNIGEKDFVAYRDVYNAIRSFVKEYGHTPDYREIVAKYKKFDFQVEVYDTFPYLCKGLKRSKVSNHMFNVLSVDAGRKFKEMEIEAFVEWMDEELGAAKAVLKSSSGLGTNYAVNGKERKKRYEEAKKAGSGMFIPTPYETLTKYLDGGFELGDYVLLQAFSNVGKSWIASHVGAFAWSAGHGIMHYSPELSKSQQENRNDTLLGHFNNVHLRNGELVDEEAYYKYLENYDDNETPYTIKTMEDIESLDVDMIEADLQMNPNIKLVIIDGFNLMSHGGKGDRTAMSKTSRRLRQLFARYQVVGIVVHQVNASEQKENAKKNDSDENPMPRPASMFGYSETIAVIQDACTVLSYDAVDGNGEIFIAKCRGTGKEKSVSLNVQYNLGWITEASAVDYF